MFHVRQLSIGKRLVLLIFWISTVLLILLILYVNIGSWLKRQPFQMVLMAESVMDRVVKAWHDEDGALFLTLMADDLVIYDARQIGFTTSAKDAASMVQRADWWSQIDMSPGAYFVAQDGRFAVFVSTLFMTSDTPGLYPVAALYAIKDGQCNYIYDYYGGIMSLTQPQPAIRSRKLNPRSVETRAAVDESTSLVETWLKAYNQRDETTYLDCYADDAQQVKLIRPSWRVLSKSELAVDVAARFRRTDFLARLEPPFGSPLVQGFFVSADGRYAAVQGRYADFGTDPVPMLVILELADGRIIRDYAYLDIEWIA
jgi:ketosteroid isomerase-like protein